MGDEYSFLQETIKDEAGSAKSLRKKIFRMILCGMIFGIVACFTFFALKPWVEGIFEKDGTEITIPEDEEEAAEQEEKEAQQKNESQQVRLLGHLQEVAKTAKPALVTVAGKNAAGETMARVSGVIIVDNEDEILVLSSNLSKKKQNHVEIRFIDGNEYTAELKKQDNNLGFGIYAVPAESIKEETRNQISTLELGNSRLVEKGDPIIILSHSSEHGIDISYGILTHDKAQKEISDGYTGLIRVDAAGMQYQDGIMVNRDGKVIGIMNTLLQEDQTLVEAYSISDMKYEIERMSNGKAVPYCGIRGTALPGALKDAGMETGIYIKDVDADSPAMEAGIQCGDIITHVADTEISDMEQYRRLLLTERVKEVLILKGLRIGADSEYVEVEFRVVVGTK